MNILFMRDLSPLFAIITHKKKSINLVFFLCFAKSMEMCIKNFYLYHKEQYLILIIKKLAIINEFFLHKDICSFVTSKTFFTENSFFYF